MSSGAVLEVFQQKRALGEAICQSMIETIKALGFSHDAGIKYPCYDQASFRLVTDPFTQSKDLVGCWFDNNLQSMGQIRFNGDGTFYAEFDVVQPHPEKTRYFVEAVNAWGREGNIKAEVRLLAMPG
jgi:hypothetical protein